MFTYLILGFLVSVYEEPIKKNPWSLYTLSILSVAIIQVRIIIQNSSSMCYYKDCGSGQLIPSHKRGCALGAITSQCQ